VSQILWSNGQDSTWAINLCRGSYNVTVSDAKGCVANGSGTVGAPPLLVADTLSTTPPATCISNDGVIDATASGGVAPYTYSIDNQQTFQTTGLFIGLSQGNYTVIVVDSNGCADSISVNLPTPPSNSVLTSSEIDVTCFGGSDGSIDLTVTGTNGPYTYAWSSGESTEDINNKTAGTYNVTVTDTNGCSVINPAPITIIEPDDITTSIIVTDVRCIGGSDGCINLTPTGGNGGYSYLWSTGGNQQNQCGFAVGVYDVTITDNRGCLGIFTGILVGEPTAISVTSTTSPVTCIGRTDGRIILSISGGTPGYTFTWNNGLPPQQIHPNVVAGTYSVTAVDANGCIATHTTIVDQIPELQINPSVKNVYCEPLRNGWIRTNPSGGTQPYSYIWSNNATTSFIAGLDTGTYSVTLIDFNGCSQTASFNIINENGFEVNANPRDTIVDLGEITPIDLNPTGGGILSAVWSPGTKLSCQDCPDPYSTTLDDITYTVYVVSDSGCVAYDTVRIRINKEYPIYIPNAFTPNGDGANDFFEIFGNKKTWLEMNIVVFNRWGEKIFESSDMNFQWDGTFKGEYQNPQVYVYEFTLTYINGYTLPKQKGSITLIR
jgi:gliding motility-associated-like protein